MIKNYFKAAWKNLSKNRFFSLINIIGLTIGTTCFLLIALYIFDELTFDRFHENASRTYRLVNHRTNPKGQLTKISGAGYQVSARAKTDFPAVQAIARLLTLGRANISTPDNSQLFHEDMNFAHPEFFDVFDFKFLHGDPATALARPHTVVMTEEMATRLFGTTDVLGKAVRVDSDSIPLAITGVLKDFPSNSSISFNLLFSESSLTSDGFRKFIDTDWDSDAFATYVVLNQRDDRKKVEAELTRLVAAHQNADNDGKSNFVLQPLEAIHFHSADIVGNSGRKGSLETIYVFSVIAFFVLVIACVNYVNLTTARYINRGREIAVRKVVGASRQNLISQFLAEAFLTTAFAMVFALMATKAALPWFNAFTEKQLAFGTGMDYRIAIGMVMTAVVVGLLSGLYPALVQAGLNPLSLMKGKTVASKNGVSLRRGLVVLQFAVSFVMIVATMVVFLQMKYVSTKDMGFNKEQLVVIDINSGAVRNNWQTIKTEFSKLAQVTDVSVSSRVPGEWKNLPKVAVRHGATGDAQENEMFFLGVDDQFLKTYEITLMEGRNFRNDPLADADAVLVNESAAKSLGIDELSAKLIEIPAVNFGGEFSALDQLVLAKVVGIVHDFNFQSLREPLAPMILGNTNNPIHNIDYFTARLVPGNTVQTLEKMQEILYGIDPNHRLEYHFLDEQWELFYRSDEIRETIFLMMALLAVIIACLGLLGLSTYAAEQRIKEIGIRKVLGAKVSGIVGLLAKDFLKLVLLAVVIATPIAWWAMNKWLEDFAYRIDIQWWMFASAGSVALVIALLTVSWQAIRAALANPVDSLRDE